MNKRIRWPYRLIAVSVCIWLAFEPLAVAASVQAPLPGEVPVMDGSEAAPVTAAAEADATAPRTAAPIVDTGAAPLAAANADAPLPTISLDRNAGYAGQLVTVSGQGVAPYPGVRVAWLTGDASLTAAVVNTRPDGSYQAAVLAPATAEPGPVEICAAVTQAELAEFACANFTITLPPPGSVHGQIPLPENGAQTAGAGALNATVSLVNRAGVLEASAPIDSEGKFVIPSVSAGSYSAYVSGITPVVVDVSDISVAPDEDVEMNLVPAWDPNYCNNNPPDVMFSTVTATPNGLPYDGTRFGTYLSQPSSAAHLDVIFSAEYLQVNEGMALGGVEFKLTGPGTNIVLSDRPSPTQARYDVTRLEPGAYNLHMRAWAVDGPCPSGIDRTIVVIPNPLSSPYLTRSRIAWNSDVLAYEFSGSMFQPGSTGAPWPIRYPDPPWGSLPLVGSVNSSLSAGLDFAGKLYLDGAVHLSFLNANAEAMLFGRHIFGPADYQLLSNQTLQVPDGNIQGAGAGFYQELATFDFSTTVFKGVVATYWNIVTVNVSVSIGMNGGVSIDGWIAPLAPAVEDARIWGRAGPYVNISIWIDILLGVASAGADVVAGAYVNLPVEIDTRRSEPVAIDWDCAFTNVYVTLKLWARVNLWFWKKKWNLGEEKLLDKYVGTRCRRNEGEKSLVSEPPPPPDVMASPMVASGPGGRMLSVYVEDLAPDSQTPQPRIQARFGSAQSGAWDAPSALTDGARAVMDPVAAFVGPDGRALVAWSENVMTEGEDAAAGDDLSAVLARQEIFFALWDGASWGAPQPLTNDLLSDGRAAVAGDATGATLAWVRDTDGDIATRLDWRIAVRHFDLATQSWSPVELLDSAGALARPGTAQTAAAAGSSSPLPADQAGSLGAVSDPYTLTVNSTVDLTDTVPGDGQCRALDGSCTLRAAVEEANALVGPNAIDLPAGVYKIGEPSNVSGRPLRVTSGALLIAAPPTMATLDGNQQLGVIDVEAQAQLTLRNLVIANSIRWQAVSNYGGQLTLENCVVRDNMNDTTAAGITNAGTLTMYNSIVSGNVVACWGGGCAGSGLVNYSSGTATIRDSTFSANSIYFEPWCTSCSDGDDYPGGGIANVGLLTIHNSTITGNSSAGFGGGIANYGELRLNNVTVAFNHADAGGGVYTNEYAQTTSAANSIIASNTVTTSSPNCLGQLISRGYNLMDVTGGCAIVGTPTGDIYGMGPQLEPLANYGGATPTHALSPASPALDSANPAPPGSSEDACATTDQRGVVRPQGVRCDMGAYEEIVAGKAMNAQVSVARNAAMVALAWTGDLDADVTTNGDRRIALATRPWGAPTWAIVVPVELPSGADSPSLAFTAQGELQLAFLTRGADGGIGNQAQVWTALSSNTRSSAGWQAAPVLDELGLPARGERPLISATGSEERLVTFRRFGDAGTNGLLGQMALAQAQGAGQFSAPLYLTDDPNQHWQPALAIDPVTHNAMVLQVTRPAMDPALPPTPQVRLRPAATTAAVAAERTTLAAGDNPVESIAIAFGADPALDPGLVFSKQHAAPGATIAVTATVRNVGRDAAANLTVSLRSGVPPSGSLLAEAPVPGPLGFNQATQVVFQIAAAGGMQPLYAQVSGGAGNLSTANDIAVGSLGALPPPAVVVVSPSAQQLNALHVSWVPAAAEAVAGYRILRSATTGGPYEFVGEAKGAGFDDVMLPAQIPFYYVVQTFDASGVRSVYSEESGGMLTVNVPAGMYLPNVMRNK